MVNLDSYRWQKTTCVDREYPLFELLDSEIAILDIGFSDEGDLEIGFNSHVGGKVVEWTRFLKLLGEGKELAERDKNQDMLSGIKTRIKTQTRKI